MVGYYLTLKEFQFQKKLLLLTLLLDNITKYDLNEYKLLILFSKFFNSS